MLPGVFADEAPPVAAAPSPSPTLSQTSEAQKREAARLAKLRAGPLQPQASPPTIQLAAALGNKFDGEWEGTFAGEQRCVKGNITIEATVKDGEFSTVVTIPDEIKNKLEGSISNDGRLSFWDRFSNIDIKYNKPENYPINITGKFTNDEFQGEYNINRAWGNCVGKIYLTRLGSGAHQLRTASREDLITGLQARSRDLKNLANQDPEEAARLAKQRAEEESRLAGLREEQRREAESLTKQLAEEGTRLASLREEQRRESERLAKLKAESEQRRMVEEVKLKADTKRKQTVEAKQDTAGVGGELKQQLAFLKNLKEEGLLDEREFKAKKSALLNRYLGLKQSAPSQTPSTQTAKTVDYAKLNEYSGVEFGKYHALVIGNNRYKHLPKLKTAKNDAEAVAEILRENYSFDVSLMIDASRDDILDALDEYREKLGYSDNLLIYYAGHGWLDEDGDEGYWLPVDARKNRRSKWLSVASVTTAIKSIDANHVMVVADSCYSGTLVRGLKITEKRTDYIRRMVEKRARVVLTSGGLEPVADSDGSGHSPFAKAFIGALDKNNSVMDGTSLFTNLRRAVVLSADQTPEFGDVRKAGHEGGDFLFVRKQ